MHPIKAIKGGALLTALFIMTLVAIVATAMSTRLQMDIYRTRLVITHDKLYLASQAIMFWAMSELNDKNIRFTKTNEQGMVDVFPQNMQNIYPQVKLSGGLYDLQSRFNLNNLVEKKFNLVFINLIGQVYPNVTAKEKTNLTLAVRDWITNYDLSRGKDNYISYYMDQKPPYNPSHQLMRSNSELRLVQEVNAPLYLVLEPFITALPETTPVNINTAPQKLIKSLGNGVSETLMNELIMARGEKGIQDLKQISELLKKLDLPKEQITLESQYFLSVANASTTDFNLVVYTLLKRYKEKNGQLTVNVVKQSFNVP